jgi:hypothetical protein
MKRQAIRTLQRHARRQQGRRHRQKHAEAQQLDLCLRRWRLWVSGQKRRQFKYGNAVHHHHHALQHRALALWKRRVERKVRARNACSAVQARRPLCMARAVWGRWKRALMHVRHAGMLGKLWVFQEQRNLRVLHKAWRQWRRVERYGQRQDARADALYRAKAGNGRRLFRAAFDALYLYLCRKRQKRVRTLVAVSHHDHVRQRNALRALRAYAESRLDHDARMVAARQVAAVNARSRALRRWKAYAHARTTIKWAGRRGQTAVLTWSLKLWSSFARTQRAQETQRRRAVRHSYAAALSKPFHAWRRLVLATKARHARRIEAGDWHSRRGLVQAMRQWHGWMHRRRVRRAEAVAATSRSVQAATRRAVRVWYQWFLRRRSLRERLDVAWEGFVRLRLQQLVSHWEAFARGRKTKRSVETGRVKWAMSTLQAGVRRRAFEGWREWHQQHMVKMYLQTRANGIHSTKVLKKAVVRWMDWIGKQRWQGILDLRASRFRRCCLQRWMFVAWRGVIQQNQKYLSQFRRALHQWKARVERRCVCVCGCVGFCCCCCCCCCCCGQSASHTSCFVSACLTSVRPSCLGGESGTGAGVWV